MFTKIAIVTLNLCACCTPFQDNPHRALALLEGAAEARTSINSMVCSIEVLSSNQKRSLTIKKQNDTYFTHLVDLGSNTDLRVVQKDHLFHEFVQTPNSDIQIYDMAKAVRLQGGTLFNPTILGLTDIMLADTDARGYFWLETDAINSIVGSESLKNGNTLWHVKQTKNSSISNYWIEEPSFRVHKRVIEWAQTKVEMTSLYDDSDSPIPSNLKIVRTDGNESMALELEIKCNRINEPIPSEEFELVSLKIPLNTAAVDNRISKIVGYWNGSFIAPNQSGPMEEVEPVKRNPGWLIYAIVIAGVLLIGGFSIRKWQSSNDS